jgi:Tol biopolymer transport system component
VAVVSGDGNWVAFESGASNLGSGITDANGTTDVYLWERATGVITPVSHTSSATTAGNGTSDRPRISSDGSVVAFQSGATDLGGGYTDPNGNQRDVFVFVRGTGSIAVASHAAAFTTTGNGPSQFPSMSANGQFVVFETLASNLGVGYTDVNGAADVYLYDRLTQNVTLVSHAVAPTATATGASNAPRDQRRRELRGVRERR